MWREIPQAKQIAFTFVGEHRVCVIVSGCIYR